MRFGLKLWSTNQDVMQKAADLIKQDVFQYVELTPIPNTDITPFLSYEIPYVIHITTERHGLNIADKQKEDFNLKIIDDCIQWADQLDAKYLILHPGFGLIDDAMDFLSLIEDDRVLIENMPKVGLFDEQMVGYSPEQIERLMGSKFGLCLDLNHAVKAAVSLKLDYKLFIKDFLKLNPLMFHISDGNLNYEKDEHLAIGEGKYDSEFLMKCIESTPNKNVTLETPRSNLKSFDDDLKNLRLLRRHIL
ncbi:TIM barrel protein [Methanococcoides seepicolus]|uniref:TIM barrel protein n=1 Tax=Methanococcoides seepicolus TaxID=2828780 RepID=A0A9E4ZGH0_9EURY|nr:TIM barrel protein [Methanococcoides seepicolus]MCM1987215.1 TIM barrel protein [Methanococcoides seepicolus]